MAYQAVFKRYELKYLLTREQKQLLLRGMEPYMQPDRYSRTSVRNIYYDTDTYLLIRRSIEKPVYKEKLRIRSYQRATADDEVFVELKRKYQSVVYKRRLAMREQEAIEWICQNRSCHEDTQIAKEIGYFIDYYKTLRPVVFLSYEREAYRCADGSDFRVTFDDRILCRQEDLSLDSEPYGTPLLPENTILMELKCAGGIPLWMTELLSQQHIYKTSFSKYGTAYKTLIFPQLHCAAAQKCEVMTND